MGDKFSKGKQFSFSALRQRASVALAGSGRQKNRPASMMNISVVREGEEGGIPSGVKMNLVSLDHASVPPPPPQQQNWLAKKQRSAVNFSCNIFPRDSADFNAAMKECEQMVLEAGGKILDITYPGGFLYDMSFANAPNPLDTYDETAGGGHITIQSYLASQIPHPHPLRSHPSRVRPGAAAASIFEHMNRFGLATDSHLCNGRDKACASSCKYTGTSRQRPASMQPLTRKDYFGTAPSRVSASPPQLQPTKRTSLIRVDDIIRQAESSATENLLPPTRLKRSSRNLNKTKALTWDEDRKARKQLDKEFDDDKALSDAGKTMRGRRARPTPIFGTVGNNPYMANRPSIPRRSSSLRRTSSEKKVPGPRRDSIVTAVRQLSISNVYSPTPLDPAEPETPRSVRAPVPLPNSPNSNEPWQYYPF